MSLNEGSAIPLLAKKSIQAKHSFQRTANESSFLHFYSNEKSYLGVF